MLNYKSNRIRFFGCLRVLQICSSRYVFHNRIGCDLLGCVDALLIMFMYFNKCLKSVKYSLMAPPSGALDAECPKSKNRKTSKKMSRNNCFSDGSAPYFACAKLYTFPMFPPFSQAA